MKLWSLVLVLLLAPGLAGAQTELAAGPQTAEIRPPYQVPLFDLPEQASLCGERVPLERRHVYEMLDREFQLSVYDHAQVVMWLKRANRYFPAIEQELKAAGLPDDLKYLAVAESALKLYAYSRAGAAGVWQFIRATGRRYGLDRSSHQDERFDFDEATRAALRYLKDLYAIFGKWSLAMAAYNCGEERVRREVEDQGVADYYLLDLPQETERYIFRILAAKLILENPKAYGYDPAKMRLYEPLEVETIEIRLRRATHLRLIAEAAECCFKELKDLNPSLRGKYLPAGTHRISVPAAGAKDFERRLANLGGSGGAAAEPPRIESSRAESGQRVYVVQKGDTLSHVAERLGVSVNHLQRKNGLKSSVIRVGQKLVY